MPTAPLGLPGSLAETRLAALNTYCASAPKPQPRTLSAGMAEMRWAPLLHPIPLFGSENSRGDRATGEAPTLMRHALVRGIGDDT